MLSRRLTYPDPIHGTIELPEWFPVIANKESVRRMMFIRQLGLKAYIDFPGAIHTRFSHALGAMQLAKKLTPMLVESLEKAGQSNKAGNLKANLSNLMAAGFLHDIGHGPFSHAVDFPASKLMGNTHEELGSKIIAEDFEGLEAHGVTLSSVTDIVEGHHAYPFVHQIVDGPIDIDKLDYLLRDSHHVGLKYHFDLEQFIHNYVVLGPDDTLSGCLLGLKNSLEAKTTAEIFVLIWKGMYDLVYYVQDSRIAEKMLERSILIGCKESSKLKGLFSEEKKYRKLYDDMLLEAIEKVGGFPNECVKMIKAGSNLYAPVLELQLSQTRYLYSRKFVESLLNFKESEVSEVSLDLGEALSGELNVKKEYVIVDIFKSRKPKPIPLMGKGMEGDPGYLEDESEIIGSIDAKIYLKAYIHPSLLLKVAKAKVKKSLKKEIERW